MRRQDCAFHSDNEKNIDIFVWKFFDLAHLTQIGLFRIIIEENERGERI